MSEQLIILRDIGKKFAEPKSEPIVALQDVSLEIDRGESVAITGRSGAGKSTLLHILAALVRPEHGTYLFDDLQVQDLGDRGLLQFRREHVGFVPQMYALMDERTVAENVTLPLRLRRWPADKIAQAVESTLGRFGLANRMNALVGRLSGGEKQRVALARAMCSGPEVILADEPTAALDMESQMEMIDCLWELNEEGTTIVLVTHDERVAKRCMREVHMANGRIEHIP